MQIEIIKTIYTTGIEKCLSGRVPLPEYRHPVDLLIFETEQHIRAIHRYCPHRSKDLAGIKPDQEHNVICPSHTMKLSLYGENSFEVRKTDDQYFLSTESDELDAQSKKQLLMKLVL